MLSKILQEALNRQVRLAAASSQAYLAIASWADIQPGLQGVTEFFYQQSDEERVHLLKLIKFINERGGFAIVPALEQPIVTFQSLKRVFEEYLRHEMGMSSSINDLVQLAFQERDYGTHNFLQWYVQEQIEEERIARVMNEKLELIGEDKSGLYLFDRDALQRRSSRAGKGGGGGSHHH